MSRPDSPGEMMGTTGNGAISRDIHWTFPLLLPNGGKTKLLMHTNTNYSLDLCILLKLFDRGY